MPEIDPPITEAEILKTAEEFQRYFEAHEDELLDLFRKNREKPTATGVEVMRGRG